MTGAYVYTPAIWPPLVAAIFLAAIGVYAWRRRDVPGARPFVAMSAASILLLLGIAAEAAAVAPATRLAWYKFQFVILIAAVTPVTCFVLDYAYPGRWLTRRNVILLSIPGFLCLLMALIDDSWLIWRRLEVGASGSVASTYAPGGTALVVYGVGMFLLYAAVFLWLFIRSPQHRWPVALMLLGQVGSRTAFLLDNAHPGASLPLDLSVFVVVLPWTTYAIAMFGFHILDPLPAARQTVIEQMLAGMVVFDAGWQVVSLNPAAESILGVRSGVAHKKTWRQLLPSQSPLPDLPNASPQDAGTAADLPEMTFGSGSNARQYAASLSPLRDFRGLLMGHLLMLRDVTEQRKNQARILEQQRSLATLQERERLARELHDGVAQMLAASHLQASTASLLLARGETAEAVGCLDDLATMTLQAETDVRDYLLGAKAVISADRPFFPTLRDYLARFSRQNGLPVELAVPPGLEEQGLTQAVEVQLLRIIQEALSNVRRHARAQHAQVIFGVTAQQFCLTIADDGQGFEPAAVAAHGEGYGLRAMRERVEGLGGDLTVNSAPGQGTQIVVQVPRTPTLNNGQSAP